MAGCPKEKRRGCFCLLRRWNARRTAARALPPGRLTLSRYRPWCQLRVLAGEQWDCGEGCSPKGNRTLQLFFSPVSFKPVICKDRQLLVRSLLHVRQLPQPQKLSGFSRSRSRRQPFAGAAQRFAQQQPHHGGRPARRPRRGACSREGCPHSLVGEATHVCS